MTKSKGERASRTSKEATCKKQKETPNEKEIYIRNGNQKG